jgi:glycosyltransferase involved in cell wall biosynthesis
MKKISIITVCYNAKDTIVDTILSVKNQYYKNIEHIIIDGASSDQTINLIKQHQHANLKWFSKKDKGIYDAMNKGIEAASGEIITFLNADDCYTKADVLSLVNEAFEDCLDYLYGNLYFIDAKTYEKKRTWHDRQRPASDFTRWGWQPAFPTIFFNYKIFKNNHLRFKTDYRISGDYDFLLRLHQQKNLNIRYLDDFIVYMRLGGASTANWKAVFIANIEVFKALKYSGFHEASSLCKVLLKVGRKLFQLHLFSSFQISPIKFFWKSHD